MMVGEYRSGMILSNMLGSSTIQMGKILSTNQKRRGRGMGIQGLVSVPFWVYWTSPCNSHYRPYTYWLGDVQWGHLMTHGIYIDKLLFCRLNHQEPPDRHGIAKLNGTESMVYSWYFSVHYLLVSSSVSQLPSGNSNSTVFNSQIIYKWTMFHSYVSVLEGT